MTLDTRLPIDHPEVENVRCYVDIMYNLKEKCERGEFDNNLISLWKEAATCLNSIPEPTQTIVFEKYFTKHYRTMFYNKPGLVIWS